MQTFYRNVSANILKMKHKDIIALFFLFSPPFYLEVSWLPLLPDIATVSKEMQQEFSLSFEVKFSSRINHLME